MKDEHSGKRRLIGIDLAWGKRDGSEPEGSGCAELVWKDGKQDELELTRLDVLGRVGEIVEWIRPGDGDWVVAIDAPLVICNKSGERSAEKQAKRFYRPFQAGARPAFLKNPDFRKHYQGRMLRKRLKELGGTLVEQTVDLNSGPLFFETYPHIAMVELFNLCITIKYKKDWIKRNCAKEHRGGCRNGGQQWLAEEICEHLCSDAAKPKPRLRMNPKLKGLLREPDSDLVGKALKGREDKLDGLICAYTAAWVDAVSRRQETDGDDLPLVGLGKVGEGVMIAPRLREIGPLLRCLTSDAESAQ